MNKVIITNSNLKHHGVIGQKWGVRRYQNSDGTRIKRGEDDVIFKKGTKGTHQTNKDSFQNFDKSTTLNSGRTYVVLGDPTESEAYDIAFSNTDKKNIVNFVTTKELKLARSDTYTNEFIDSFGSEKDYQKFLNKVINLQDRHKDPVNRLLSGLFTMGISELMQPYYTAKNKKISSDLAKDATKDLRIAENTLGVNNSKTPYKISFSNREEKVRKLFMNQADITLKALKEKGYSGVYDSNPVSPSFKSKSSYIIWDTDSLKVTGTQSRKYSMSEQTKEEMENRLQELIKIRDKGVS